MEFLVVVIILYFLFNNVLFIMASKQVAFDNKKNQASLSGENFEKWPQLK